MPQIARCVSSPQDPAELTLDPDSPPSLPASTETPPAHPGTLACIGSLLPLFGFQTIRAPSLPCSPPGTFSLACNPACNLQPPCLANWVPRIPRYLRALQSFRPHCVRQLIRQRHHVSGACPETRRPGGRRGSAS